MVSSTGFFYIVGAAVVLGILVATAQFSSSPSNARTHHSSKYLVPIGANTVNWDAADDKKIDWKAQPEFTIPELTSGTVDPVYGNVADAPTGLPMLAIRGMYHSGTSWLRHVFTVNSQGTEYVRRLYGGKHGNFTDKHAAILKENPRHTMVFIYRGLFSWLPKMHAKSYSSLVDEQGRTRVSFIMSFSEFLRVHIVCGSDCNDGSMSAQEQYRSAMKGNIENHIVLRSRRYWNWIEQSATLGAGVGAPTDNVTYEKTVADECGTVRELMKRHSISIPSKCPKSKTLVKLGAILDTPYDSSDDVDVTKYMAKYTLADLAFVLKHVDGRLEHLLGYNYESERQWAISQFGKDAVAKLFWLV